MAEMTEIAQRHVTVSIEDVWVRYRSEVASEGRSTAGTRLAELVLPHRRRGVVEALKGITLEVREGEHLGILGANGSGKSTLLRVIAGLQQPEQGLVRATATPVLLGVQSALVQQLSGRRNIRLGLLALGFSPDEIAERVPVIVDLAGIGNAINRPMNTYSSGMSARLAFSIAAAAEPQILLIDEALGTGDAAFAKRSSDAIERIRQKAGTIFLVSHAAQTIETMCTRAIWLNEGELVADGDAVEVARTYRWWAWQMASNEHDAAAQVLQQARDGFLVASTEERR